VSSSIDWAGLAVIAGVVAALGFGARLVSDGWIKSGLRVLFLVLLVVVAAVFLWNLTVSLLAGREG
jgi:hypothetical protein